MQPALVTMRAIAAVIDLVVFVFVMTTLLIFADLAGTGAAERFTDPENLEANALILAGYCSYYLLFEWLTGTTPGKRVMKMRVVLADGSPVDASAAFIRNLVRPLDSMFFYLVGFMAVVLTSSNQRIGDLAARTLVVSTRPEQSKEEET
ncbi:MAG: RDD family protein [Chloroflexota bacterium]